MIQRIITALVILFAAIPPLLFGGILLKLLIALVLLVAGFELFKLLPNYRKTSKWIYLGIIVYLFIMLIVSKEFIFALFALGCLIIMALPVFVQTMDSNDSFMIVFIFAFFYILGYSFEQIYLLNPLYIWLIILATYACDTGAYFTGYFLGKRKLCERISPKKTVEGAIGGICTSYLVSFIFLMTIFKGYDLSLVAIAVVTLPIISQIGDLVFSVIKRNHGIKDFSNIFPGHGGFLDRLDSLSFNIVWFYVLVVVIL